MHFDYVTFIIPALFLLSAQDYFGSAYISKVSRRRALEEHGCLSHSVLSSVLPPW